MDEGRLAEALEIESDLQRKVSESISRLEVAIAEWDEAKPEERPAELEQRMNYLRSSYNLLCFWERESLTGTKDERSVVKRLQDFAGICRTLEITRVA